MEQDLVCLEEQLGDRIESLLSSARAVQAQAVEEKAVQAIAVQEKSAQGEAVCGGGGRLQA
ncbi:hypothetical protein [Prochlorococcus sp. MIT 1201]|uniref:hypothetical protein n=1 Tax=Prochlorococcus sp. MIT 1201 TaxID=3082535 RepID=UPI0039A41023